MKKIILTITLLTFSLFMVGCGGPDTEDKGNEEKINNVIQLIDELPLSAKIDATHKEQIKEAREAYDALTEVEKASVTNYAKLTTSESKLTRVLEGEDEETIEEIEELISLLPSIDQLSVNDRASVDAIDELITKLHLKTRNDIPNILIFDILLGMIIVLMTKSGGSAAYGKWAGEKIKSKKTSLLATMGLGILIFVDDYFKKCYNTGNYIINEYHLLT